MKRIFYLLFAVLSVSSRLIGQGALELNVDYLFWHATQSKMSYAILVNDISLLSSQDLQNQKTNWSSGFRLGGGYEASCTWSSHFAWTHFHNSVKGNADNNGVLVATQLLAPNIGVVIGNDASSKWNLKLDMFDFNVGFHLLKHSRCKLQPFIGIKGGKIDQNEFIRFQNFFDVGTDVALNATTNQINNYWGVGLQAGLNSSYYVGYGFSLVSDLTIATLCGRRHSMSITDIDSLGVTTSQKFIDKTGQLIPITQIFIGFRSCNPLFNCCCACLDAGYEIQYYWNTWRTQNSTTQNFYVSNVGFGDLMMQGLTLRFALLY